MHARNWKLMATGFFEQFFPGFFRLNRIDIECHRDFWTRYLNFRNMYEISPNEKFFLLGCNQESGVSWRMAKQRPACHSGENAFIAAEGSDFMFIGSNLFNSAVEKKYRSSGDILSLSVSSDQ